MKVVIPMFNLEVGGGPKVLVLLADELQRRGHEVEIVIPQNASVFYTTLAKITRIPSLSKPYIPYGDIILTNFFLTFRPAFEAWPRQCIRYCMGFETFFAESINQQEVLWSYQQGVPTISISKWLDEQIFRHTGRRSTIIPPGIDLSIYTPKKEPDILSTDNIKKILYVARNPSYTAKGYNDFIEAMRLVKQMTAKPFLVQFVCHEQFSHPADIPHISLFPKSEAEMAEHYRQADLFVSTSRYEGFSLPIIEAMACGTPVVTTNSGGNLDFCRHKENAFVVEAKQPAQVAQGIVEVLNDPVMYNQFHHEGIATAQRYTLNQFLDNMASELERISLVLK